MRCLPVILTEMENDLNFMIQWQSLWITSSWRCHVGSTDSRLPSNSLWESKGKIYTWTLQPNKGSKLPLKCTNNRNFVMQPKICNTSRTKNDNRSFVRNENAVCDSTLLRLMHINALLSSNFDFPSGEVAKFGSSAKGKTVYGISNPSSWNCSLTLI